CRAPELPRRRSAPPAAITSEALSDQSPWRARRPRNHAAAHRRALTAVRLAEEHDAVAVAGEPLHYLGRAVGRAVVDDDDLGVELELRDPLQHLADRRGFVVRGDEERDSQQTRREPSGGRAR